MKNIAHHLRNVQRKVIRSTRREALSASANQIDLVHSTLDGMNRTKQSRKKS